VILETLHGVSREVGIELLLGELIGYRVVVLIEFDMIVDMSPDLFPFGTCFPCHWRHCWKKWLYW
jgi:hypothetical protein